MDDSLTPCVNEKGEPQETNPAYNVKLLGELELMLPPNTPKSSPIEVTFKVDALGVYVKEVSKGGAAELAGIKENDIITADITYGSKAMPIIIRSALAYISENVVGADIDKIVYGSLNFTSGKMFIYDVSALFYLDKAIESMSRTNVKDPKAALISIIDMGR